MSDQRCSKYSDCALCDLAQEQIFKYRTYSKRVILPTDECLQNTMYFLLKGRVQVTSEEHPNTVFGSGQFILQPIGSTVSFTILEPVECIIYLFDQPMSVCNERYTKGLLIAGDSPLVPIVKTMCLPLFHFLEGMKMYLNDSMLCTNFLSAKRSELVYLLTCYYTVKEMGAFYAPIYRYTKSFQYFVLQNYQQAKNVETFASLGGYSVSTFRRLFKDAFGEPVYQWMLKKKCQEMYNDLTKTDLPISEICYKYGFESLSNFSHFCRTNLGKSPRVIRSGANEIL